MIEAELLTKRYGKTVAVDGASFTIQPGRVTGFLGPNGAGKSTTMRMILGLDAPSSGTVRVNGKPYGELTDPLRSVGALLDAKAVVGSRTAANHLGWLCASNDIDRRRVDEVLDLVGLQDVAAKRVGTFSLGMSQRLGIAAALLGDPGTVMFDEPINGLDPDGILWIRNLMKSLAAEGRTVFLSSHLMSEMAQTADHLLVIGRGRIIADTSVDEFVNRNSAPSVRVRALEQTDLASALTQRGSARRVLFRRLLGRHGARRGCDRGDCFCERLHPCRAIPAGELARRSLLRVHKRRDRIPRRPADRLDERNMR